MVNASFLTKTKGNRKNINKVPGYLGASPTESLMDWYLRMGK